MTGNILVFTTPSLQLYKKGTTSPIPNLGKKTALQGETENKYTVQVIHFRDLFFHDKSKCHKHRGLLIFSYLCIFLLKRDHDVGNGVFCPEL